MSLRTRLAKLEAVTAPGRSVLELDLPMALTGRVEAAQAAGTFPASLSDDDLTAILHAADAAKVHQ